MHFPNHLIRQILVLNSFSYRLPDIFALEFERKMPFRSNFFGLSNNNCKVAYTSRCQANFPTFLRSSLAYHSCQNVSGMVQLNRTQAAMSGGITDFFGDFFKFSVHSNKGTLSIILLDRDSCFKFVFVLTCRHFCPRI